MDKKLLKATGILCVSLIERRETARFLAALTDDPNWRVARIHKGYDYSEPGIVQSDIRHAQTNSLDSMPALVEHMDARVKARILPDINRHYRGNYNDVGEYKVVRYEIGGHYNIHIDNGPNQEHRHFTVLCYLNDDLDGGETIFPDIDVAVQPIAGRAIAFPCEYRHGALAVKRGVKYVFVCSIIAKPAPRWI